MFVKIMFDPVKSPYDLPPHDHPLPQHDPSTQPISIRYRSLILVLLAGFVLVQLDFMAA